MGTPPWVSQQKVLSYVMTISVGHVFFDTLYFPKITALFKITFFLSGLRQSFKSCLAGEESFRMNFYPRYNYKPQIGSEFVFSINFDGKENEPCAASFNIEGSEIMYHVIFRINSVNQYRVIAQNSITNGGWGNEVGAPMPNLLDVNEVVVEIAPEGYYKLTWNGVQMSTKYPLQSERFPNFKRLFLNYEGSCFTVDLEKSYIRDTQLLG